MEITDDVRTSKFKQSHIIIIVCAVLFLAFIFWVYSVYRETQNAAELTPESVAKAFQKAGYDVSNIQETDEHPGPMAVPKHGIRFDMSAGGKLYEVLVVLYEDPLDARRSASQINELDQRMSGEYARAFDHGPILVQLYPSDAKIACKLKSVLRALT